jgi:hypothetical protein
MTAYYFDLGSTEHTCRTIRCRSFDEMLETAKQLRPGVTLTVTLDEDTITARPS